MSARRLILLGASVCALAVAGPVSSAFADSANQTASSSGSSQGSNSSGTTQGAGQTQSSGTSCTAGCGGSGQAQDTSQSSSTTQSASSSADASQTAVNANVPVTISGGGVKVGDKSIGAAPAAPSSSASQTLSNSAIVERVQHRLDQPIRRSEPVEQQ